MIPLIVFGTVGVTGLGWFGYKASKRIALWGHNMNDIDQIFQATNAEEEEAQMQAVRSRMAEDARAKGPFVGQHLPAGRAASR
ncbi:MAG TPA: hypothetical protein VGU46_01780 [Acidobacteriaceae bacterium]|nr:hypothetical protein [Acidobacteriaceae bacterium]